MNLRSLSPVFAFILIMSAAACTNKLGPTHSQALIDQNTIENTDPALDAKPESKNEKKSPDDQSNDQTKNVKPVEHKIDDGVAVAHPALAYSKMEWTRSGGGDLSFAITPPNKGGEVFLIQVTRYSFRDIDLKFSIELSSSLYAELLELFSGKMTITETPPTNALGGTWTKLVLTGSDGTKTEIKTPKVEGAYSEVFMHLENYLNQAFKAHEQKTDQELDPSRPCATLSTITGTYQSTAHDGTQTTTTTSKIWLDRDAPVSTNEEAALGTDEVETQGCFGGPAKTSYGVTYRYNKATCVITQTVEGRKVKYKILLVEVKDGKTQITISLNDEVIVLKAL